MRIIVVLLCIFIPLIVARSIRKIDNEHAIKELRKYGYMRTDGSIMHALTEQSSLRTGLEEYQMSMGLEVTGELDTDTIEMLKKPRCGNMHAKQQSDTHRPKRFVVEGSNWKSHNVSYRVTQYSQYISGADTDDTIKRALQVWSSVTPLEFYRTTGNVDIGVRFAAGQHGDGTAFDGPGKTLAHAFFPKFGGDSHFDEDEQWTTNSYSGINLFQIAAHEFGHSLGIDHSSVQGAIMFPAYLGYNPTAGLHSDDITGIQSIYGGPETTPSVAIPTITEPTLERKHHVPLL